METYRRDFTIGERETQRFYRMLTLRKWSRGILGFGAAGALDRKSTRLNSSH